MHRDVNLAEPPQNKFYQAEKYDLSLPIYTIFIVTNKGIAPSHALYV